MDFTLTLADDSATAEPEVSGADADGGFQLSADPLVAPQSEIDGQLAELPRSYGGDTLCLMPRDPRSVFAYWDIDWSAAFRDGNPLERKVHLRILAANGRTETEVEVQAMASGQIIETATDNSVYTGVIGYYGTDGAWISVATSAPVNTPAALPVDVFTGAVATIPFHLSFQRMLDVLQTPPQGDEPLTTKLADLRARADSGTGDFSAAQRDLVESLDEVIAKTPPPAFRLQPRPEVWTRERVEQILGFSPSSPTAGFSGSSRAV